MLCLSEQKRLAAKQKEDAWEGKWLHRKWSPIHKFCFGVFFFKIPWFSKMRTCLCPLLICFSQVATPSNHHAPQKWIPTVFLSVCHKTLPTVIEPLISHFPTVLDEIRRVSSYSLIFVDNQTQISWSIHAGIVASGPQLQLSLTWTSFYISSLYCSNFTVKHWVQTFVKGNKYFVILTEQSCVCLLLWDFYRWLE